ncbi:hypothetical protein OG992_18800 [Micromonospora sp. NBC_00362]|uniref:hypothetical protein n=1 Tax=Micromonospora sp. NBC_00362 TaxID=2975975 RepID=UPI002255DAD0|nr:hypothetical protein [Micromonospora sp. NBC_00362]MCX5119239.1 hypothetical protein [Micromonospora sp. NBC_00362]
MTAPTQTWSAEARQFLTETLPKGAHKHIDEIVSWFGYADNPSELTIPGARVPVEIVEAYGLSIEVDANGNAATVTFPHGAEVTA